MTVLRNRLSLSALAAASSFIAISAPVHAQSICSATGAAVACTNGGATTTLDAGATLTAGVLQGLQITDTTPLPLTIGGTIATSDASPALVVSTTGGDLTLAAPTAGAVNLTTTGTGVGAVLVASAAPANLVATLGTLNTTGAWSLLAAGGASANVTTGAITATNVALSPVTLFGSPIGAAAMVVSPNGPATLTTGNVTASGSANPLAGALSLASSPTGVATTTVNGSVTVNGTGGTAIGAAAISGGSLAPVVGVGGGAATVNATGPVLVTGTTGATGLGAISTNNGAASVTAGGNVTARGADATGIIGLGGTVNISAPNATITATDTDTTGSINDAVGVEAHATNALTVNVGQVVSSGDGIVADTSGGTTAALGVTAKGIQAGLTGVSVAASGATPVTVTTTGPVAAANGFGITVAGVNGPVIVSEAGANGSLGGVLATTGGTGAVTVNATGGTTTSTGGDAIHLASGGAATTTVGTGAVVLGQGAFDGIDTTSAVGATNTVNVAGTVAASGTGVALRATGGPAAVNVQSGGVLAGQIALTGANDTVTVQSGGSFRPAGAVNFGAGAADALNVQSGGVLQLGTTTAFSGLETLNNAGSIGLSAGTVSLAGVTTLNNTGALVATGGATTLGGMTTFTNNGTISLVDGATDDVLTLGTTASPTNYVGAAGARLAVDVNTTAATPTADRLVITGNASGSTLVSPSFVGGVASYNPAGVTIVTTTGTAASGAFAIDPGAVNQGFLNAGLTQTGGTTRLVTTLDSSVTGLGLVGTFGRDLWYQSFDAYDDAVRGRHAGSLTTGHPIGIWGQMYRSRDRVGDDGLTVTTANGTTLAYSDRMKVDRGGAQVGVEFRGTGFVVGGTAGYEWADTRDFDPALITAEGHNWGVYGLFGMANGIYGGVIYKRDDHDIHYFNTARGTNAEFNNARSEGVDGEVGLKGDAGAIGFDVQAGLSWVKTTVGSLNRQGLDFTWDDNKSLRGRLGARVIFPQAMGAFVGAKVYHEFKDDGVFRVTNNGASVADIAMPHRGTWVRLEGGLDSFGIKGALLTVWGDIGESKSIGARLGFRF